MLTKAVNENRTDIARFLIENGTPVPPDKHLLHAAVSHDNPEMAELLLGFCSVDEIDDDGNAPLHLVRSRPMAELLLARGAAPDVRDRQGRFPYETTADEEASRLLREHYDVLHPALPAPVSDTPFEDWEHRFTIEKLSMHDLIPIDSDRPEQTRIRFDGREFRLSKRFFSSFARRMKFSTNVFNYFTPQEVLTRVSEQKPDIGFQATFDNHTGEVLGVTDPDRKLLPAHIACKVISDDPRTTEIVYNDGVWQAKLMLDEKFHVPKAGDYFRQLLLRYPVDGLGMPSIYLATMRMVCRNGAVAAVSQFRTDIEVNDESGTHLGKLLKSFSNDYGFTAMNERLIAAQDTVASVRELLSFDAMIADAISDKNAYRVIHDRLNDIAGDPCYQYGVTSLQNIPQKKQTLMPVACSVNDLLNISSELTTHHGELLRNPHAFDEMTGRMLAQEFDLEGIYHAKDRPSPDFFLNDLKIKGHRARESRERAENTVYVHE